MKSIKIPETITLEEKMFLVEFAVLTHQNVKVKEGKRLGK